jgi:hypothetical protein
MRMICTLLAAVIAAAFTLLPRASADDVLSLGLCRPGVMLRQSDFDPAAPLRPWGPSSPSEMWIDLVENGRTRRVLGLNDLAGSVHIDTAGDALRYVRLRTSQATWYLWHSCGAVEVLDRKRSWGLPNYGLKMGSVRSVPSGFLGVLSEEAYEREKLPPASVTATATGFSISRWVLVRSRSDAGVEHYRLEQWQEDVGRTGSYRCRYLRVRSAQDGPGIGWQIPTFQ